MYRILIPNGEPSGWTLETDHIPEHAIVNWSNTVYMDGHREGWIQVYADRPSYHIEEVL